MKGGKMISFFLKMSYVYLCFLVAQMVKNPPVMQKTQVGCSRITADVTAATKLRHLLYGKKAMANIGRVLKSRDISLSHRFIVKAMVFPVVWMSELDHKES